MPAYVLPELSYDYSALEPHISADIMRLHHDKHHKAYVDGANKTLEQLEEARTTEKFDRLAQLERQLAFHLSGHTLHSIFWKNLKPKAGGQPTGDLAKAIESDFGNFGAFKTQLTQSAMTLMGSGWAVLAWDTLSKRLLTLQIQDHQSQTAMSCVPVLALDGWEHAWYLQYKTDKASFFQAVWNLWNWEDVAQRLAAAKTLNLLK